MGSPFPVISSNMSVNSVIELVKQADAVVLVDNDGISGILTKADLM